MCPDTPQKSLSGGHDKVLKASTWPPNSSNPYQIEFARNTVTVPCGKLHSLLTVPPYCRTVCHDKPQKLLRNGQKDVTKTSRCQPGLSILQIWIKSSTVSTKHPSTGLITVAPPSTHWTQRIHYKCPGARHHRQTLRGPVSMPRWVRDKSDPR